MLHQSINLVFRRRTPLRQSQLRARPFRKPRSNAKFTRSVWIFRKETFLIFIFSGKIQNRLKHNTIRGPIKNPRRFTVFLSNFREDLRIRSPGCILIIVLYSGASQSFIAIYIKSCQKCTEKVNQYEWGNSKLQSRDHKVYYRTLRVIGSCETIEIKTGSHIMIENQD